jgi:hypothetical protein
MRLKHYDGGDVVVVDVRDPRRELSHVSEVVLEPGNALVMLSGAAAASQSDLMGALGYGSPDETPAYSIRSRATSEVYFCGPVRLALVPNVLA